MRGKSRFIGQAIVELALGLPLILLLILGVLELGRAFFVKIAMTNAAREGANYLVYNNDNLGQNFADAKYRVMNEVFNSGLTIAPEDIQVHCLDVTIDPDGIITSEAENLDCSSNSTIEVIVSFNHQLAIFGFLAKSVEMHSNARMVMP